MAKHDQRILKFLNQNSDRAPTITEMMTRLNISISDISDSLGSLQAGGLISKKTNNQGIECWFPTGPQASPQQVPPIQVHAPHLQNMPTTQMPIPAPMPVEGRNREEVRAPVDSRFMASAQERPMQAPEPQPPAPKQPPVQVSHIPMAEPVYTPRGIPPQPEPAMSGSAPMYGLSQPAPKGIGILTFVAGLVLAIGISAWLGGRMAAKEVEKASKTFVDRKSLSDATTAFNDFQEKTKAHVTTLEAEVKQLSAQLALSKSMADSLQTSMAAKPAETDAADAKGKTAAGKKTAAKGKPAQPVAKAKPAKPTSTSNAIAKAAARGAAKKRKTAATRPSSLEGSDYSSSSESSSNESGSSPSVPEPPGLEELPPPPSE
jgi:hypothetical protein